MLRPFLSTSSSRSSSCRIVHASVLSDFVSLYHSFSKGLIKISPLSVALIYPPPPRSMLFSTISAVRLPTSLTKRARVWVTETDVCLVDYSEFRLYKQANTHTHSLNLSLPFHPFFFKGEKDGWRKWVMLWFYDEAGVVWVAQTVPVCRTIPLAFKHNTNNGRISHQLENRAFFSVVPPVSLMLTCM